MLNSPLTNVDWINGRVYAGHVLTLLAGNKTVTNKETKMTKSVLIILVELVFLIQSVYFLLF